jgi:hypothetical protein
MKWFRRILSGVVLLVVIAGVVIYMNLNRIVKNAVQSNASSSLNLQTTLSSAGLSLFGGKVNLHQLDIASPQGYSAPHMLEVGDTKVAVSYGQLRQQPIHVTSITIDKPRLVIEQQNGVFNFKKAMDQMPKSETPPEPNKEPMKLVIDQLTVSDAQVVIHPNLPGLPTELTVPVPSMVMKDVGSGEGSQNGAAVKDVVMQVITALAGNASNSSALPEQLKSLLHVNIAQATAQLTAEAQKRVAALIPGQLGQALSQAVKDPQSLLKDPSKALQGLVGGNVPGSANSPPASQPRDMKDQAVQTLQGVLGGKKK